MRLFAGVVGDDFMLMYDNSRPTYIGMVRLYLVQSGYIYELITALVKEWGEYSLGGLST